jgi:D-alanyl-D-alanine carboxypeptidase (penicillin-binding protein 5/6)
MTALVTLEQADLDDTFTAPAYHGLAAESTLGLEPGERMKVRDLLKALLLESANDAAETLAQGVAGSEKDFVDLMNRKAEDLGLDHTRYANPIGLDDPDNYSTARDLATLAARAMEDEDFAEIVGMPSATLETGDHPRTVTNRNELVSTKLVDGVKTGYTIDAGNVLVGSGTSHGVHVISAVLGEATEDGRDRDTLALLQYGKRAYERYEAVAPGQELAKAGIRGADGQVPLVARKGVTITIGDGDEGAVDVRVSAPSVLEGPLADGTRIGGAKVLYHGDEAGKVTLETGAAVPAPALSVRAQGFIERNLGWMVLAVAAIVALVAVVRLRSRRKRSEGRRR